MWPTRLFAPDKAELLTLEDWLARVPGADPVLAGAWLRDGAPAVPAELAAALRHAGLDDFGQVNARPGHPTALGAGVEHRHAALVCGKAQGATRVLACVVADGPGGLGDPDPEEPAARHVLPGVDPGAHPAVLWRAAAATLAEARERAAADAALVVHRVGGGPGDPRAEAFRDALAEAGAPLRVLVV